MGLYHLQSLLKKQNNIRQSSPSTLNFVNSKYCSQHIHTMRYSHFWTVAATTVAATATVTTASAYVPSHYYHLRSSRLKRIQQSKPSITCCFSSSSDKDNNVDDFYGHSSPSNAATLPFASTYHAPVMWKECIQALLSCQRAQARKLQNNNNNDDSTPLFFVDGTLGGGGHSEALLEELRPGDVVFGCDVDPNALSEASKRLHKYMTPSPQQPLFVPVQSNFGQLAKKLPTITFPNSSDRILPQDKHCVDGILLDLGVSSHQIDTPERGFAFMKDGPLDMRMDSTDTSLTAADLCNELEENELARIFKQYGDEPRARVIAKSVVKHRPLQTTGDLQEAVGAVVPAFHKSKRKGRTATLARVFQSLRIVVNQEDRVLQQVLEEACPTLLREGGRLVVLSYHSMEDRATKRVMRDGTIAKQRGTPERDIYGDYIGPKKPFKPVGKFQKASEEEVELNSRARSAVLRMAERLEVSNEEPGDGEN